MESKAENIVKNIGAIAETVSIFYNSISKQVPKDVALVLTQHFMDLTINRRPAGGLVISKDVAAAIAAARAVQEQRQKQKDPSGETEKPQEPPQTEEKNGEES